MSTTTVTATTTSDWPSIDSTCPAWCEDAATGHEPEPHADDRTHYSKRVEMRSGLELERPIYDSEDKKLYPILVAAYLWQNYRQAVPTVHVVRADETHLVLTVDEAAELGSILTDLAAQARRA